MDIRRLPLWEGRNVTYMSNDLVSAVIEDQGEVMLELSSDCFAGGRVNPLCLPYFRGTGSGVLSDPNGEWYRMKQTLYQAGGSYFTFPFSSEDMITSNNTYWSMRKYGTEEENGGVWRYSSMKSREENNRYSLDKIDYMVPGEHVVYTAVRMKNRGETPLEANPGMNTMLGSPFVASGCLMDTNARHFSAYQKAMREVASNRFESGPVFDDLKRVPLQKGGTCDASIVPPPTGTYDYLLGKIPDKGPVGWTSFINPRLQMVFFTFTPILVEDDELRFPNVNFVQNYYGRMDVPWALWDGATSQVFSVTSGFNFGPKGSRNVILLPGEEKVLYYANAFESYDNPRMGLGFYSAEFNTEGVVLKRTKSYLTLKCDYSFYKLRRLRKKLFSAEEQ